jgi:hypothetical protein
MLPLYSRHTCSADTGLSPRRGALAHACPDDDAARFLPRCLLPVQVGLHHFLRSGPTRCFGSKPSATEWTDRPGRAGQLRKPASAGYHIPAMPGRHQKFDDSSKRIWRAADIESGRISCSSGLEETGAFELAGLIGRLLTFVADMAPLRGRQCESPAMVAEEAGGYQSAVYFGSGNTLFSSPVLKTRNAASTNKSSKQ